MVTTRQQNATAEANPSVKKFTKEQNDFKIKECQQYASKKPLDQYHLNLYVLDLNYNPTTTESIKPIVTWLVDFTLKIIMGLIIIK